MLTVLDIINLCTTVAQPKAKAEEHYFTVELQEIDDPYVDLLDEKNVITYLSQVAPVPFDAGKFRDSIRIKDYFREKGHAICDYQIRINGSPINIMKPYSNQFETGHQQRSQKTDYVRDVEFFSGETDQGDLLYLGWIGISNFYGSIKNANIRGIRLRKGNILVGNEEMFNRFFSSEGAASNACFIGEVHIYDPDIIPNAKRDDFEKNEAYKVLSKKLNNYANQIKSKYRYGMSELNSAFKAIDATEKKLSRLKQDAEAGVITSDTHRENLLNEVKAAEKLIEQKKKDLEKVLAKPQLDEEQKAKAKSYANQSERLKKQIVEVETKIINADYATKLDLPTNYTKSERKMYQRIIHVIDVFFAKDREAAEALREKIVEELREYKK
jgi:molecular chaperone HtpG